MRTLLTSAQRVSRVWNTMIRTSVRLQESLFFKLSCGCCEGLLIDIIEDDVKLEYFCELE
jgi:hypothetical protein